MKPAWSSIPAHQLEALRLQGPAGKTEVAVAQVASGTTCSVVRAPVNLARVAALKAGLADGSMRRDCQLIAAGMVEALVQPTIFR
jgi:anti-sigma28 factor (negative regulator of flagellin synthesis)